MGNSESKVDACDSVLERQFLEMKALATYAESKHQIDKDYKEAQLAYMLCLNTYTNIVQQKKATKYVLDLLFPHAKAWLLKALDIENLLFTRNIQKAYSEAEIDNCGKRTPVNFQEIVDNYLGSDKAYYITVEAEKKIKVLVKVLTLTKPDIKLSDVVGSEKAKSNAYETIIYSLKDAEMKKFRDGKPMGCVFYGPPGTGKTHLAKAIANEAGCTFMQITPTQIDNKYHGESAGNVEAVFILARILQPTIIMIDEIETMLPIRSNDASKTDSKTISKLLTEMEGKGGQQVFIIGCTNYPDRIDTAFRRRFQRFIHVTLPDVKAQSELMQKWYAGFNHTITKAEFQYIAQKLKGMSPTDINKFMDHAITKKKSELYDSEKVKLCSFRDGPKYVACLPNAPNAIKVPKIELLNKPCAFKPVTGTFLLNFILQAKPNVDESVIKRYEDFEKQLGPLC